MPRVVTFGEVMLRLSPPGHLRFSQAGSFDVVYGGSEANVAVSLATYGVESAFATRLPDNDLGDCAVNSLRARGVDTDAIVRGGDRLGVYFFEVGAVVRASKVIYDRGGSGMATIAPGMIDWRAALADADWFHWSGITPALSQGAADACGEAIGVANELGVPVSVDLNYRESLWRYGKRPVEVMPRLVEGCDVVLGGAVEASRNLGLDLDRRARPGVRDTSPALYLPTIKAVHEMFPRCRLAVSTMRGGFSATHNTWSGTLFDGEHQLSSRTYEITDIVDRLGGGDSFMAGLIYGLLHFPGDPQRALDFAVAGSALKHTIHGDANLATVAEVERLLDGDLSGRIKR